MSEPANVLKLRVGKVAASPWVGKALVGLVTFLALTLLTSLPYLTPRPGLREGQVSLRDIEAPRSVVFVDLGRTEALRRAARESIEPIYRLQTDVTEQSLDLVERTVSVVARTRAATGLTRRQRADMIRRESPIRLSDPAITAALTLDRAGIEAAWKAAFDTVQKVMGAGIRPSDLAGSQAEARVQLRSAAGGRALTLASAVVAGALRANRLIDEDATETLRRQAMATVEPVMTSVLRGEMIVRRGERVRSGHIRKLAALGLVQAPLSWSRIAGMGLISLLLLLVTAAYLRQYQPDIWAQDRLLRVWALGVILTVALARILFTRFNPYLIPTAAGTMLIAVLLRPRLALYTAAVLSLLVGFVSGGDLRLALVTFVGSTVCVYAIKRIDHRTDLIVAGLQVGAANVLAVLAIGLVDQLQWQDVLRDIGNALGNGLLVGIIAIGTLPYLEHLFGLVTPIKLLELSNPNHPLLRRLQIEAPGTYHHSIMVANLAEAAAEAIGADSLLVRVGAYYHDVGKIRRPVFFIENQIGVDNPHDKMSPSLSALTVQSHVRDGLDYAKEHGLPESVSAFIPQHHGRSLITYFYHQAKERGESVDEGSFRYEGPKPQSREAAILMLADAAEGAVRSMGRPTPDRIEQTVRRIIRDRLEDGQLDECDLTFRELDIIASTFVRLLASMFHPRVEYPDLERDLGGRRREPAARAT